MQFRPADDPRQGPDDPVEWADNALSNSFAWASYRMVPSWCQTPEHWTSRLTQYVFTDCPCCLLFRGITIGIVIGWIMAAMIVAIAIRLELQ